MAVLSTLADAVLGVLNDGDFCMEFTATRKYQPTSTLKDMADLHVTVVPGDQTCVPQSRSKDLWTYTVEVGIQQRCDPDDNDIVDDLLSLVEELIDQFRGIRISDIDGINGAAWTKSENSPTFSREHMQEKRQFTSVIVLTFIMSRQ